MRAELDFYKIVDALGDGVICVDEKNLIVYINKRAAEIIEVTSLPIMGGQVEEFFNVSTPYTGSIINEVIEDVRTNGVTRGFEKDAYIETAHSGLMYLAASVTRIQTGKDDFVIINFREITQLKLLEIENREQKQNLESIFNALPVGITIVDMNRNVKLINPYMVRNFKVSRSYTGDVLLGNLLRCKYTDDRYCGLGQECHNCKIRKTIEEFMHNELEFYSIKVKYPHYIKDDLVERYYEVGFVRLHHLVQDQVMIMINDITDQVNYESHINKARDDAEQANRLKSEFLSNMSHEIRTPLNGIIGMIDLSKRKVDDQVVVDYLNTAKTSSLNLLQIINSVLDISKIESGRFQISERRFNLERMLKEVYQENVAKIQTEHVKLVLKEYNATKKHYISDDLRIKQVLNNLVDNAIKFTEKGTVTIASTVVCTHKEYTLEVKVTDTGSGMSKAYMDRMFERFTQEDGSFTRQKGGTGLGLAISKSIVTILGGNIYCESEEGKGTTFSVIIPLKDAKKEKSTKSLGKSGEADLKILPENPLLTGKILLVEDDRVNQAVIKEQLELDGHLVDIAINGKEGVASFKDNPDYDLILMDIQMPVMSGIEAIKLIRQLPGGEEVPVIALTALAMKENKEDIMVHGFDMFISKPVQLFKLSNIIRRILNAENKQELTGTVDINDMICESVNEIRGMLKLMKIQFAQQNMADLDATAEMLVRSIEKNGLNDIKSSAFRLQMDIRKEKFVNFDKLIQDISCGLDHAMIE